MPVDLPETIQNHNLRQVHRRNNLTTIEILSYSTTNRANTS